MSSGCTGWEEGWLLDPCATAGTTHEEEEY